MLFNGLRPALQCQRYLNFAINSHTAANLCIQRCMSSKVKRFHAKNYKQFKSYIDKLSGKKINIFLGGSTTNAGVSWCQRCTAAHPLVIAAVKQHAKMGTVFVSAEVGNEVEYRDKNNPFRRDEDIKLTTIPTLLKWDSVGRLHGTQLQNPNLLKSFFESDAE